MKDHESIDFAWDPDQIKLESAEVANTTSTQYGLGTELTRMEF
jgi:hypothetical protein